eukprot:TRINITY_DN57071_c0_g1_i1.p1 TRINITY_DN57071_c0_g1~~TRINITY_DN57071_c0_g1_i1.p1  ORF type:complete len:518 (-),score=108.90 TRINITY_DN57071_c0_g1_i1:59-1612(-)
MAEAIAAPPWHLQVSYLTSGWHASTGTEHGPLLPSLRDRVAEGPTDIARNSKASRPLSALAAIAQGRSAHDTTCAAERRMSPAPPLDWRRPIGPRGGFQSARESASSSKKASGGGGGGGNGGALSPLSDGAPALGSYHAGDSPERSAKGKCTTLHDAIEASFFESALQDEESLLSITSRFPGLRRLRLTGHHWFSTEILEQLGSCVPRLHELGLSGTRASDAAISAFATNCPELRILDVSECAMLRDLSCIGSLRSLREFRANRCPQAVTPAVVAKLQHMRLEVLELNFCTLVDAESLLDLSKSCHTLQQMCLSGCPLVTNDAVVAMCAANLGIFRMSLALNDAQLSDEPVARAVECLKRAKILDFGGCRSLGFHLGTSISWNCQCLEELCLAGTDVQDAEVARIFRDCKLLQCLDLSNCSHITDEGLQGAPHHAKQLRRLVLTNVHQVSEEALVSLRASLPGCTVQREARKFIDPMNLTSVLGEPWWVRAERLAKDKPKGQAKKKAGGGTKKGKKR